MGNRYAVVVDGVVVNVALSDEPLGDGWIASDTAGIGDLYADGEFTRPPQVIPVPASVTPRQARLALLAQGQLAAVEAAIDELPEPDRTAARVTWDYATIIERDSPLVSMLGAAAGLTEGDIDDLFRLAQSM